MRTSVSLSCSMMTVALAKARGRLTRALASVVRVTAVMGPPVDTVLVPSHPTSEREKGQEGLSHLPTCPPASPPRPANAPGISLTSRHGEYIVRGLASRRFDPRTI